MLRRDLKMGIIFKKDFQSKNSNSERFPTHCDERAMHFYWASIQACAHHRAPAIHAVYRLYLILLTPIEIL